MTNRIQFKAFKADVFDAETGIVEGYASTYNNADKANDVVVKGAFDSALLNGPERVRFLWEHDRKSVIGVITDMSEDDNGLYIKAQFAKTQKAQETRDLMKMGAVDSFSIGYRVLREQKGTIGQKSVNFLKEIQLLEVSCVAWPCNIEARMTGIKTEMDERLDSLNLEQQALVSKFIDFLEAETKIEQAKEEVTAEEPLEVKVDEGALEAPENVADNKDELKAIQDAFAVHEVILALKGY